MYRNIYIGLDRKHGKKNIAFIWQYLKSKGAFPLSTMIATITSTASAINHFDVISTKTVAGIPLLETATFTATSQSLD